jgi:hypothetical protein
VEATSARRWTDVLWFVLIVAVAGGVRFWYLFTCHDATDVAPVYLAQTPSPPYHHVPVTKFLGKDEPSEQDQLIANVRDKNWFGCRAPLAADEADTAYVAPGYPWLVALLYRVVGEADAVPVIRWIQCGIGALTAGLYFVFARMVFGSVAVAVLTGMLCAFNPFWVINAGQVEDGVVASLLLAACLLTGTRASRIGDAISSLLFGLFLAGLCLVRAAMLPFAVVALLWFLRRSRELPRGWFFALLAVLGFVNGVAPWTVRNYQTFHDVVPIVDSAWLHLWMGNNPGATGAEMDRVGVQMALSKERLDQLRQEPAENRRYQMLAEDVQQFVRDHPYLAVKSRIKACLYFWLGEKSSDQVPDSHSEHFQLIVNGTMLGMLLLALLAWRWTYPWRTQSGLATLALVLVPLPYIISHAESLWGPRLPLDGLLMCYSAFALVYMLPGLRSQLARGPT